MCTLETQSIQTNLDGIPDIGRKLKEAQKDGTNTMQQKFWSQVKWALPSLKVMVLNLQILGRIPENFDVSVYISEEKIK